MANGDETTSSEHKFNARSAVKLPEFQAPIIISCILPGGYRYLHVRKPGDGYQSDQVIYCIYIRRKIDLVHYCIYIF